jgi:REP element-mobilizing transposase RayT
MANTFTHLLYHCVWSTKNRQPLILPEIEQRVWGLLATTATTHGMHIQRAGGIENHVHVLIEIPKTLSMSDAMKELKGGSSNAINKASFTDTPFGWQIGYGAFTVSKSVAPDVVKYIVNQREHHRSVSYEEEFKKLLEKHGLEYDPKYVLD